uniref:Progestin and adipoQ receptor family member 9 n=1 Tax=Anser cygnoides TaxID=8845 RepID=A0A8B9IKA3_ANSCY
MTRCHRDTRSQPAPSKRALQKSPRLPDAPSPGHFPAVPEDFVECFILSGYRRLHCSAQECLASVLQPTNETLNFWTHFIPLLLFLSRFGRLLLLRGAGDVPFHHPALLPLWCYASGVLLTFTMSCTAHLFSCLSPRLRAAFFYLDYASISYYGFASTVAYSYYLLPGLSLLDASAMSHYVMACPIMLESLLFDLRTRNPTLFVYFYRRYCWLLVAAFFNVSKIPERIQPGLFDIVGHSHQLFHIFTFLSIYDQVHYVEDGLAEFLKASPATPTYLGTVGYMLLLTGSKQTLTGMLLLRV